MQTKSSSPPLAGALVSEKRTPQIQQCAISWRVGLGKNEGKLQQGATDGYVAGITTKGGWIDTAEG